MNSLSFHPSLDWLHSNSPSSGLSPKSYPCKWPLLFIISIGHLDWFCSGMSIKSNFNSLVLFYNWVLTFQWTKLVLLSVRPSYTEIHCVLPHLALTSRFSSTWRAQRHFACVLWRRADCWSFTGRLSIPSTKGCESLPFRKHIPDCGCKSRVRVPSEHRKVPLSGQGHF